ncbi:MAG: HAMP domain-containing protein, partial [Deefgea sp.]
MRQSLPKKIPFYIHISYLFIALLIGFALISGWNQYQVTSVILKQSADQQFQLAAKATKKEIENIYESGARSTELLAQERLMSATTLEERLDSLKFISTMLKYNPVLIAQFIGYETGDFFLVRPYNANPAVQKRFTPPAGTQWIVQSITHVEGEPRGEYLFFDQNLQQIERRLVPDYKFDPRRRDWYKAKEKPQQLLITQPYFFASSGVAGITFAQQTANQRGVVGSDIQLEHINTLLLTHKITPDTRLVLLSQDERVIASHQGTPKLITDAAGVFNLPKLSSFDTPILKAFLGMTQGKAANASTFALESGDQWEGLAVKISLPNLPPLQLLMATPHRELMATAIAERNRSVVVSLMIIAFGLLAAVWLARRASKPINALSHEIHKIEQFQFTEPVQIKTNITEIARLADSLGAMKTTIHHFMELSQALAAETNFGRLLARILDELGAVSRAEGGVIFTTHADMQHIEAAQYFWQGKAQSAAGKSAAIALNGEHVFAKALSSQQILRTITPSEFEASFPLLPATDKNLSQLTLP